MKRTRLLPLGLLLTILAVVPAACGGDDDEEQAAETTAAATSVPETSAAETTEAEETMTAAAVETTVEETTAEVTTAAETTAAEETSGAGAAATVAAECQKGQLQTREDGVLTVGTDKPAFPPYFEDDDPSNGRGFESAVAYAVAQQLGFAQADVKWIVVPFNSSYAPGAKKFDFDINQISISPQRDEAVDFSEPYYTTPQAVLVTGDGEFASATSLADLKDARIGVQIGTTSLDAATQAIQPSRDPRVYDTSNDVVAALKNGQVDAIVIDLPTALYLAAVEIEGGKIVGQFSAPGGDEWGLLMENDSPLKTCLDQAIAALEASGELQEITDRWIGADAAPILE